MGFWALTGTILVVVALVSGDNSVQPKTNDDRIRNIFSLKSGDNPLPSTPKSQLVVTSMCSDPKNYVTLSSPDSFVIISPPDYRRNRRKNTCGQMILAPAGYYINVRCYDIFNRLRNSDRISVTLNKNGQKFTYSSRNMFTDKMFRDSTIEFELRYSGRPRLGPLYFCAARIVPGSGTTEMTTTTTGVPPPSDRCVCGLPNRVTRIVGGIPTDKNEYPWQVALISTFDRMPFCGGSLVSNKYIVTAAHCTAGFPASWIRVLLGGHSTSSPNPSEQIVNVVRKIEHRGYNDTTLDYDVAILEIETPLDFTIAPAGIRPVCLPMNNSDMFVGDVATASGWGITTEGGLQPTILHEVNVPVLSNADCKQAYGSENITANMICAGARLKDTCQGDSGGPLITKTGMNYDLIGVTSWGVGCGRPGYPGVYARITAMWNFINSTIASSTVCPRS